jgi:hypothetical protein
MSRVAELIDLIVQGKNAEASDVLNSELLTRSHQAINDIKPSISGDYFAPVIDMPSDGSQVTMERPPEQEEELTDEAD